MRKRYLPCNLHLLCRSRRAASADFSPSPDGVPPQCVPASRRCRFFCGRGSPPHPAHRRDRCGRIFYSGLSPRFSQSRSYRFPEGLPGRESGSRLSSSRCVRPGIRGFSLLLLKDRSDLPPESRVLLPDLDCHGMPYPTGAPAVSRYSRGSRLPRTDCWPNFPDGGSPRKSALSPLWRL